MSYEQFGTVSPVSELVNDETIDRANIEYYNVDNPRSIFNIVNKRFQEKIVNPLLKRYLVMDEWRLKLKVDGTPTLHRLRISFWREFDRAQSRQINIDNKRVYEGICSSEQYHVITSNVKQLAWILKPPTSYVNAMEESLQFGVDRMREILAAPIYRKKWVKVYYDEEVNVGTDNEPIWKETQKSRFEEVEEFDVNSATLIIKTVALLDARVKGPLVQRLQIQNQTIPTPKIPETIQGQLTNSELDRKIKELESDIDKDVKKISAPYTVKELKKVHDLGIKVEEVVELPPRKAEELEKEFLNEL